MRSPRSPRRQFDQHTFDIVSVLRHRKPFRTEVLRGDPAHGDAVDREIRIDRLQRDHLVISHSGPGIGKTNGLRTEGYERRDVRLDRQRHDRTPRIVGRDRDALRLHPGPLGPEGHLDLRGFPGSEHLLGQLRSRAAAPGLDLQYDQRPRTGVHEGKRSSKDLGIHDRTEVMLRGTEDDLAVDAATLRNSRIGYQHENMTSQCQ